MFCVCVCVFYNKMDLLFVVVGGGGVLFVEIVSRNKKQEFGARKLGEIELKMMMLLLLPPKDETSSALYI